MGLGRGRGEGETGGDEEGASSLHKWGERRVARRIGNHLGKKPQKPLAGQKSGDENRPDSMFSVNKQGAFYPFVMKGEHHPLVGGENRPKNPEMGWRRSRSPLGSQALCSD
jgi:hypothetical protein